MDYLVEAERLIALGYRRTSNRYRIVSRIDRHDWVQVLAEDLMRAPADFYIPGENRPASNWADHYRRCYSRDKIEGVSEEVFKLIPLSGDRECGFVGVAITEPIRVMKSPKGQHIVTGKITAYFYRETRWDQIKFWLWMLFTGRVTITWGHK